MHKPPRDVRRAPTLVLCKKGALDQTADEPLLKMLDAVPAEAETAPDYRLQDQIGFLLRKAHQRHVSIFAAHMPDLTPPQFAALAKLGINTTADLTNRLAVASDASLFTHAGADHRLAISKATATDTASLLLEDNLSARAEIGLSGDDALHLKVSPDGSTWIEALNIAQTSGLVSLPLGQLAFPPTQNPSSNANTLDDYEEGSWTPVLQFSGAATGVTYGAATLGRYTRIGNLVAVSGMLTLTSKGTSVGAAQIAGLPFTSLNDGIYSGIAVGYATGFSSVTGAVIGLLLANASKIGLYQSNNGAGSVLTQGNVGNTSAIYFSASYQAA